MDGETVDAEMLEGFGVSIYMEFNDDGTGTINMMGMRKPSSGRKARSTPTERP